MLLVGSCCLSTFELGKPSSLPISQGCRMVALLPLGPAASTVLAMISSRFALERHVQTRFIMHFFTEPVKYCIRTHALQCSAMRQSQLFTKTRKNAPKDEVAKNAQLLIRAGYIHKEMAGVYAYLPLGLRVVEKIKQIVREEMNAIGGQEIIMTNLQRQDLWEKTDRWDDEKVDVWFKSVLKAGGEVGFGWSHEEPITDMMKQFIASYRDLPAYVYQFQTKLRNELRAKSGIMRGKESVMKDMYSYSINEEQHKEFYDKATAAYLKVFERLSLGDRTFLTVAS